MPLTLLPAVDVAGGRCVRTRSEQDDPSTVAGEFARAGASWVHLVDLDAAYGRGSNADQLAQVISGLEVAVQLSGGINDARSLTAALATEARRINLATSALADLGWCAEVVAEHGDRIAISLDVNRGQLAPRGRGLPDQLPRLDLADTVARLAQAGCAHFVVTDVSRDGALTGPNLALIRQVCALSTVPVICSGGVSTLDDLRSLAELTLYGLEGVIVGTALHSGAFTLAEALAALGTPQSGAPRRQVA